MEQVGDHQLGVTRLLGLKNFLGIFNAGGHWLFNEKVDACFKCVDNQIGVLRVWGCHVNGVNFAGRQQIAISFVGS